MKFIHYVLFSVLIGSVFSHPAVAQSQPQSQSPAPAAEESAVPENTRARAVSFLWVLTGTEEIFPCDIPVTEAGTTRGECHRHQVLDLMTNKIIGTALDTSADVEVVGSGLTALGTTTFNITGLGSLVVRGRGSIQPTLVKGAQFVWKSRALPGLQPTPITNIASITPTQPFQNMVLSGTGVFTGATGPFALFGALEASKPDRQTFNCIFKIDLELPRRY
jgi:hypothetical protein